MANLIYGFKNLADIAEVRAVSVDPTQLQSAVTTSRAQHDAAINEVLDLFSEQTTEIQLKFKGVGVTTENQPLDEFGRSRKIKGRSEYTTGFPIFRSGQARGTNFITNAKMTVQQYNDNLGDLFAGDVLWIRNRLLASLFINTNRTYDDPNTDTGEVTVSPLANGDAVVYGRTNGVTAAVDDHYKAFANAISDTDNPFPTLYDEIKEHPDNQGEVVTFISSTLKQPSPTTGVRALTNFIEIGDPVIAPAPDQPSLRRTTIGGFTLPATATLLGRTDDQWVAEWPVIPAGYGFTMTTQGKRPLKRRVDEEEELRGFTPIATREDFPYFDEQWIRSMGFGAWNRTAAVMFRVGNGSYAIPAPFNAMRW